jgi:hypothetical protein
MPEAIQIETQSKEKSLTLLHGDVRPGLRAESLRFSEEKRVSIKARRR